MRINKLILENFSSFEGNNEFDFSIVSREKNIILIGGQNGAGKTSLFSAIKIALYGPLAFGYVGANSHYTQRIKEFINTKAYQTDNVEAAVIINISIKAEREYYDYEISRHWYFINQKFEEIYEVKKEGKVLDDNERLYFENYFQDIVPPTLFDFFLFDGEEVGNIFATNRYNKYVRDALFTMCGLDVYEIIRNYTSNFISKLSDNAAEVDDTQYKEAEKKVKDIEQCIAIDESRILELRDEKETIDVQIQELNIAYRNAGGITVEERQRLLTELAEAEKVKQEITLQLKSFVEGLMPFYIVKDFAAKVSDQLDYEEKGEIFFYIQQRIQKQEIKHILQKFQFDNDEMADELLSTFLNAFRPQDASEYRVPIHDLSKEELRKVNGVFSALEGFDKNSILDKIHKKQDAMEHTMEINKILKNSMSVEDVNKFAEKENALLKAREGIINELFEREQKLGEEKEMLVKLEQERKQQYQLLVDSVQNRHVYELSSGISSIMNGLLRVKINSIKATLEALIVENLQKIYRKDNLITHIEIEDNFQFNLYQNVKYSREELLALINNLGAEEVTRLVGQKGADELLDRYHVESIYKLREVLTENEGIDSIDTYKRIELRRLSKGERQIFILSLYWAIIMISGKDIPFIIDTPYARIDANHRQEISKKFFPHISKQVIILSTDEEIDEEFYQVIHPYVAKEYLLINNEKENRTIIENRYFFEVKP